MGALSVFLLILAGALTKLTSSLDDVVWLLPYLVTAEKDKQKRGRRLISKKQLVNSAKYVAAMLFVVTCAIGVVLGAGSMLEAILGEESYWSAERVLMLCSAIMLTLYTCKLIKESIDEAREKSEDCDEESAERQTNPVTTERFEISPSAATDEIELSIPNLRRVTSRQSADVFHEALVSFADEVRTTQPENEMPPDSRQDAEQSKMTLDTVKNERSGKHKSSLLSVALMGSMDDFAVLTSFLMSGTFLWWQLLVGNLVGSLIVVGIVLSAGQLTFVVRFMSFIPLYVIIGTFSVYTWISLFLL